MDSQPTEKVEGLGDDFVRGGQDKTPIKQKRNSCQRIVVSASTPTVTVTEGNEQYSAPWTDESPGGTVITSAYKDEKKRCLSVKGGSGDPRKKAKVQTDTFNRAHRKIGRGKHRVLDKRVWALSVSRLNQLRKNHVEQARQHKHYRLSL